MPKIHRPLLRAAPPTTVLSAPLLHMKGHQKQAKGTAHVPIYKKARRVVLLQQHAQLATRFTCLVYTVYGRATSRARP
jgi:hypothetical protein